MVYGDRAVLEALARFEEAGPSLTNPRSTQCFLQLALTMRAKADVDAERLRTVLVGPKGPSAVNSAGTGTPNDVESALPGTSVPQ